MKEIDLEFTFKAYLERVGLDEKLMSAIQLQETKRAFYGGLSQMWKLFLEIGELPEENTDVIFNNVERQISQFWANEELNSHRIISKSK